MTIYGKTKIYRWYRKMTMSDGIQKRPFMAIQKCIYCVVKWSFFIPRHTIVAGYNGFTLDVLVLVHPSVVCLSIRLSVHFSFPDDNLSKLLWIFTKLGMCIDIVEIWFGIANGQISSNFYGVICLRHAHILVSG